MANKRTPEHVLQEAVNVLEECGGNQSEATRRLGLKARQTLLSRLGMAAKLGIKPKPAGFIVDPMADPDEPLDELLDRRTKAFLRKDKAEQERKLINVRIKIDGPIGILHMGDPHVDDDGCDLPALRRHIDIIQNVEGMFGANVGDLQNNWVGRLSHLYGQQETSKRTAWRLTEWLVRSVDWLYLVGGNHDAWSGTGDPLQWITRDQTGVFDMHGVRLRLTFPNGKQIRVNARHDFRGHSMWNPTHGPIKAAKMGWRDHLLTCGHTHQSGYQLDKDPMTGLISHALRLAGYKRHDGYGKELGLPDANISPAAVTIIDPSREDNDPGLITVIHDVERAAEFLTYLRKGKKRRAA